MRIRCGLVCAVSLLAADAVHATTYSVDPAEIDVRQVDLEFEDIPPLPDSQFGWLSVENVPVLQSTTGGSVDRGYVNVSTAQGWVVRNLLVDANSGATGIGTFFDLGESPGDVSSLQALVELSDTPLLSHGPVDLADPLHFVGEFVFNAQGAGGAGGGPSDPTSNPRPENPDPTTRIDMSAVTFEAGPIEVAWQPNHPNIEQAKNQCGPGAVANSLEYLRLAFGASSTAHANVPGQLDNTLVGKLDTAMGRPADSYTPKALSMLKGKLDYLNGNNLLTGVDIAHKQAPGYTWLNGNIASTAGQLVSQEDTSSTGLIEWILARVAQGADVEIRIAWDGGGAHAVQLTGAGRIFGRPYVTYAHDALQGVAGGLDQKQGGLGFTWIDDDLGIASLVPGKFQTGKISYALSESPAQDSDIPTVSEWGLIVLALLLASGFTLVWSGHPATATASGPGDTLVPPLFVAGVFWRVLAGVVLAALVGLAGAFALQGEVAAVDVGGVLLCAVLLAFLLHHWIAMKGS
jgi:hypothetical protein